MKTIFIKNKQRYMKSIFLTLIIICGYFSNAQPPTYTLKQDTPRVIPNGAYLQDNLHILDKFVGTWKCQQNGTELKVVLYQFPHYLIVDYYCDELFGYYVYTVNGVEVVNTFSYTGDEAKIQMVWWGRSNDTKLVLEFYDPARPMISTTFLTLDYSNVAGTEKLHWNLFIGGFRPRLDTDPTPILTHRVPMNCDLIR
ncbi:MAG: hypothetical protein CFE24_03935 [Flavobacterium sp. BFFFF2]|nr:MAG: hypothetical protein CFE24_03935 [Flavobacterium sp. BFFFF2]